MRSGSRGNQRSKVLFFVGKETNFARVNQMPISQHERMEVPSFCTSEQRCSIGNERAEWRALLGTIEAILSSECKCSDVRPFCTSKAKFLYNISFGNNF